MKVRRVVTGHDESGRSVFLSDGPAPRHKDFQDLPGHGMAQVWCSGEGRGRVMTRPRSKAHLFRGQGKTRC